MIFDLERVPYGRSSSQNDNNLQELKNSLGSLDWSGKKTKSVASNESASPKEAEKESKKSNNKKDDKKIKKKPTTMNDETKSEENKIKKEIEADNDNETDFQDLPGSVFPDSPGHDVFAQCVSCDLAMSKGIAVNFCERFPKHRDALVSQKPTVGMAILIGDEKSERYIYLFSKSLKSDKH